MEKYFVAHVDKFGFRTLEKEEKNDATMQPPAVPAKEKLKQ